MGNQHFQQEHHHLLVAKSNRVVDLTSNSLATGNRVALSKNPRQMLKQLVGRSLKIYRPQFMGGPSGPNVQRTKQFVSQLDRPLYFHVLEHMNLCQRLVPDPKSSEQTTIGH